MSSDIHGTDPEEQRRLTRLNEELNDRCLRELPVKPGQRVLDVGSGLGQLTRALARAARAEGVRSS
jgi:16S rRNA A1518/A1519 N6-dimethyltransferase RsmA/KsgA/DIM1 with predicted DNA glycosylase/AP lyase activity